MLQMYAGFRSLEWISKQTNVTLTNIFKISNPATEATGPCVKSEVGVRLPNNHTQKYKLLIQKKVLIS